STSSIREAADRSPAIRLRAWHRLRGKRYGRGNQVPLSFPARPVADAGGAAAAAAAAGAGILAAGPGGAKAGLAGAAGGCRAAGSGEPERRPAGLPGRGATPCRGPWAL